MTESISADALLHHELRFNKIAHVSRHRLHPTLRDLPGVMRASHQRRVNIILEGTPFEVFSELRYTADGNTIYYVAANRDLAGGRIKSGATLYFGVSASRLSTSPLAWRKILGEYLAACVAGPFGVRFSSVADMPKRLPWCAGYLTPDSEHLSDADQSLLIELAQQMAVILTSWGQQDSQVAERAGRKFIPDPFEFPELT